MANSETGTSTNNTLGGEYQVFLSFRGPDTRDGFTDILHQALVDVGIRVFMDDEDLRPGERISGNLEWAIDNSKLYIPIFSKDYASSHWCLRELARMVENTSKSKEDEKKVMLPIFYDVKPDDVKLKTELYNEAISNLEKKMEGQEKKFSSEDIKTWRRALKEVVGTSGFELNKKYPSQAKLIQAVVNAVVVKLKTRQRRVTKDLVGMEDRMADINKLLDIDSDGVRLIGICGMGGIGKTTLATKIFNQLCPRFSRSCSFLEDVRGMAKDNRLVKLQKKLLSDISYTSVDHTIDNIDHGINMIEDTICNKKVLIVLDNVDEADQIQKLIGEKSLCPGTIILVTTRDRSILIIRRFEYKFKEYEMTRLSKEHALELFSRHAFNDSSPPTNYYTLSEMIVSTTDGLPLALEAIGSMLFNLEEKRIWEETLEKLRKTPHDDVRRTLKISYDALNMDQQQIFLDIACFFIGENKINPMHVWKDCEFCPEHSILVLIRKCMIKVLDDDTFRMHDQFRDLGRAIAKEEQTRLWDEDDIICKLRSTEIKGSVQALRLAGLRGLKTATSNEIKRFPHIRFLCLHSVICEGDFTGCLSELKWIDLSYPYSLPGNHDYNQCWKATNLGLENMVVVNLYGLDITEDVFESIIKGRKLKVLTIEYNNSIHRIPTIPKHSVLEKLTIDHFWSLTEIDCSIGNLKQLTELTFQSCFYLKKLPSQIGELQRLEHLTVKYCKRMRELPDSVSKLVSLTELDVSHTSIEKLPSTVSELRHLKTLILDSSRGPLNFDSSKGIQNLPPLPGSLTTLECYSLLTIPNLSYLTNLVVLDLSIRFDTRARSDIIRTCDLQWIGKLSKLRKLKFRFSDVYAPTSELGFLSLLKELTLCGVDLPTFKQLPSDLIVLKLYETRGKQVHLDGLPPSEKERSVCQPEEAGCNELQAPELIEHWRGEILFPSSLKTLQKCCLSGFPEVQEIRFVSTFESLEIFSVEECSSLKSLGGLSNSKNLKRLTIEECPSLKVVEGIDELEFLYWLGICGCTSMGRIFDASSSKIPKECTISITCSGELPDCGERTWYSWDLYREKILNGTKQASDSEIETTNSETETGDPLQKTNQENKEKKSERKTESAKQQGRRKRRKLQKKAWVRLFRPIISLCRTRKMKTRKNRARLSAKEQEKRKGKKDLKWALGTRWLSRSQIVNRIGIRVLSFSCC